MNVIKKKLMALGLASIMTTSFVGCSNSNDNNNDISIDKETTIPRYDENNNELTIIALYNKEYKEILETELYGYFSYDAEKDNYYFYDILNERTFTINDDFTNKFTIYGIKFDDYLEATKYFNSEDLLLDYYSFNSILKYKLEEIENKVNAYNKKGRYYLYHNESIFEHIIFIDLDAIDFKNYVNKQSNSINEDTGKDNDSESKVLTYK